MPLSYMVNGVPIEMGYTFRLDAALPDTTAMPPAEVEEMVEKTQRIVGPTGEQQYRPYAYSFPGEIRVERTGASPPIWG